jgi:hypothetical protein
MASSREPYQYLPENLANQNAFLCGQTVLVYFCTHSIAMLLSQNDHY